MSSGKQNWRSTIRTALTTGSCLVPAHILHQGEHHLRNGWRRLGHSSTEDLSHNREGVLVRAELAVLHRARSAGQLAVVVFIRAFQNRNERFKRALPALEDGPH